MSLNPRLKNRPIFLQSHDPQACYFDQIGEVHRLGILKGRMMTQKDRQALHNEAIRLAEREQEIFDIVKPLLEERKRIQARIYEIAKALRS